MLLNLYRHPDHATAWTRADILRASGFSEHDIESGLTVANPWKPERARRHDR